MANPLNDQICDPLSFDFHNTLIFSVCNQNENCVVENMSWSDDTTSVFECTSLSIVSHSEIDSLEASACLTSDEIRSTRQEITTQWVKAMSQFNLDFSFTSREDNSESDSESDSDDNGIKESCRERDSDDSFIFFDDSCQSNVVTNNAEQRDADDDKLACDEDDDYSAVVFSISEVVTEENFKNGFSMSSKGSLLTLTEDDFLEDGEIDLVFSTSPLSTANLSGWSASINEKAGLSQNDKYDFFADYFELSSKSKALKDINDQWNKDMQDVDEKPRTPVKVTFASSPNLVKVQCFQKPKEEAVAYDTTILDRLRFQRRILELSSVLSPVLSEEHRTNVFSRNVCNFP